MPPTTKAMGENAAMYAGKERRNRIVALVLAAVLLGSAILALLVTMTQSAHASPALTAHAQLVSVEPANGSDLAEAPREIRLTFDDVIAEQFARVQLTRDGMPVETSAPAVQQTVVTSRITGEARPGAYQIVWQVTSDDGHPVSGESTFRVRAASGGSTAAAPVPVPHVTPTYKTPQMQPTTFGHPDHLPGLVTAGVLLLGGVALMGYEHRRRKAARLQHEAERVSGR